MSLSSPQPNPTQVRDRLDMLVRQGHLRLQLKETIRVRGTRRSISFQGSLFCKESFSPRRRVQNLYSVVRHSILDDIVGNV